MTKQNRLLEALRKGDELTAPQIRTRFAIPNPSAVVNDLRRAGWAVNSDRKQTKYGEVQKYYMSKSAARRKA